MNILFAASEVYPFAASGGLGDVAGSLPGALQKQGLSLRVILPLYAQVAQNFRQEMKYVTNFTVGLGWRNQYCGLFVLVRGGVSYYFLDNEYYFKRQGLYGFYDDGERFAFFARAVLESLQYIDYTPDCIHCNDWQSALIPVYLHLFYRRIEKYANIKTLFTIHNIQYQGKFGMDILEGTLGIEAKDAHVLEYDAVVNYMKGGIECCDAVSTVSKTYAQEILGAWHGYGLDGFLREKQYKLCGIVNGIDTCEYNPETDIFLAENYNEKTAPQGKAACKRELRAEFGLLQSPAPVVGMVTRLVAAKGLDLVRQVAQQLLDTGFQLVLLGAGESEYEKFFRALREKTPGSFGLHLGFEPRLARKIYAGSDMFLMPSLSEPCGLAQMLALRYGSVPIVRQTGGLSDTVQDSGGGQGNGFTFSNFSAQDMLGACLRAKEGFANKEGWQVLLQRAMQSNCSWGASAMQYKQLYQNIMQGASTACL